MVRGPVFAALRVKKKKKKKKMRLHLQPKKFQNSTDSRKHIYYSYHKSRYIYIYRICN